MPGYHLYNPRNISLSDAQGDHVQLGHLVRLPFRYRVPGIFRFRGDDNGIQLFLRNSLVVAPGKTSADLLCERRTSWDEVESALQTDALIVFEKAEPSQEGLEGLEVGDSSKIEFTPSALQAHRFLNEFTIAYLAAAGDSVGIHCPRLLTTQEFFNTGRLYVTILCPPQSSLTDEEIGTVLDLCTVEGSRCSTHGELADLPPTALSLVPVALAAHRQHIFYEFVIRSRAAREQEEFQISLLLACVALEAVHAALFHVLMPKSGSERDREVLINNLLREQGFHTLFRVTSIFLLQPKEQPAPDLIDECKKAIEMRNDIMHAKSRRGRYKMRQHSWRELVKAQSAVLKMVGVFEAALRRRVPIVV